MDGEKVSFIIKKYNKELTFLEDRSIFWNQDFTLYKVSLLSDGQFKKLNHLKGSKWITKHYLWLFVWQISFKKEHFSVFTFTPFQLEFFLKLAFLTVEAHFRKLFLIVKKKHISIDDAKN